LGRFVALSVNVSLIVATLDLKLVQLVVGAMRTADIASARERGPLAPAAIYERRRVIHPEPRYERRRVIHPEPRREIRRIEHIDKICPDTVPACAATCPPEPSHITPSPIQPPWMTLPWKNPPQPGRVIKVVAYRPDTIQKGSMLDCFI
jgi:hypothetical protein